MLVSFLRSTFLGAVTALAFEVTAPKTAHAQAYPIDCAILLCLSGGWPASVPCTRAWAEFIRRITPWPVEPPLQIWRCPMGASHGIDPDRPPAMRLWDAALDADAVPSYPVRTSVGPDRSRPASSSVEQERLRVSELAHGTASHLHRMQDIRHGAGRADIDISGAAFDFVRSIRVFMVSGRQRETGPEGDHDCERESSVRVGRYGIQGDYAWHRSSMAEVPPAFAIPFG